MRYYHPIVKGEKQIHIKRSDLPKVSKLMDVNRGCSPNGSPILGVTDTGGSVTSPCLHANLDIHSFIHPLSPSFTGEGGSFPPQEAGVPPPVPLCAVGGGPALRRRGTLPHFGTSGPVGMPHKGTSGLLRSEHQHPYPHPRLWGQDASAAGAERTLPVRSWARSPQGRASAARTPALLGDPSPGTDGARALAARPACPPPPSTPPPPCRGYSGTLAPNLHRRNLWKVGESQVLPASQPLLSLPRPDS